MRRPYSEREDIERTLRIYEDVRSAYQKVLEINSSARESELYKRPISELDLSVRARSCLESAGISTIGQLLEYTEGKLFTIRSFGRVSLVEVKRKLGELGLSITSGN